jgi:ParB family chromosome partitioning protein
MEGQLRQVLGTKVNLISRNKGGRIVIEYFSKEDLMRILNILGIAMSEQGPA